MLRSVYSSRSFITSNLSVKSVAVQQAIRFSSTNVIVSFKKVTFGYTDTKMLLDDVSFNIREGKF
jgi:ABC-type transport system involved in Fe-S cluster assembly fused permease/ATPase subunit